MSWKPNLGGRCPDEARGKRVKVRLRNGRVDGDKPVSSDSRAGWPADSSVGAKGPPTRWTLEGGPFDVIEWDFV
jgi:hypothetical protein